jgi:uncharacterized protein (TIGR02996 family)
MSPPPGHKPFLRAICEAPEDDAPRLVYADWLDENGDADRAEFIRRHVHLGRNPDDVGAGHRCAELFRAHGRRWVAELPGPGEWWAEYPDLTVRLPDPGESDTAWTDQDAGLADWSRGFPANLYLRGSALRLAVHGLEIADVVPVRRLFLSHAADADALVRTLAESPLLGRLRDLIAHWPMLSDDAVIALAESPRAAHLKYIALEAGSLTGRAAAALADSPNLGGIEMLHLLHGQFDDVARARLRARFGFAVHC